MTDSSITVSIKAKNLSGYRVALHVPSMMPPGVSAIAWQRDAVSNLIQEKSEDDLTSAFTRAGVNTTTAQAGAKFLKASTIACHVRRTYLTQLEPS